MSILKSRIKEMGVIIKKRKIEPVWAGPSSVGPQGGVTQSLIGRWLSCRERFRLLVIDGWQPREMFNERMEFGNMWHVCEENFAAGNNHLDPLIEYTESLGKRFPMDRGEIDLWYHKAAALFPLYIDYWRNHPDVRARTPLLQEAKFDVPYKLPSGRTVRLRGKWDSVDLVDGRVWIQENKTKSKIDSVKIGRQCTFDLQTMTYLTALDKSTDLRDSWKGDPPIVGVRYNCIRRSAHKSVESMLEKFGVDQRNGRIGEWFARWNVEVSQDDVVKFKRECLDPVLENICDDYEWWVDVAAHGKTDGYDVWNMKVRDESFGHWIRHFRLPFGVYSPVHEGGASDLDRMLETGSMAGLHQTTNLFPELA